MNIYIQVLTQTQTVDVVNLLLFPAAFFEKAVQGQIKVATGGAVLKRKWAGTNTLLSSVARGQFNEIETTYSGILDTDRHWQITSVVSVLRPSPSCVLWCHSRDWVRGGDRAMRSRRMNAKAKEEGLENYNVQYGPSVLEVVVRVDTTRNPGEVLDRFAERLICCIPAILAPLKIFGCADAGGALLFTELDAGTFHLRHIRVMSKVWPPEYAMLGDRFEALHPIMFGAKKLCEGIGLTLTGHASVTPSKNIDDLAIVRLSRDYNRQVCSELASEWLIPNEVPQGISEE